ANSVPQRQTAPGPAPMESIYSVSLKWPRPPPVSTVCTVHKEQVPYAKALADCQAFFPGCEARPRRARRRGTRRRVGECSPARMAHTQPLVSPTAAYVRPDAIQRRLECVAVWPWAARVVVGAGTTR